MNKYDIPNVKTFEFTKIIGIENIEFGKYIIIDDFAFIYARKRVKIGDYVHIGGFSSITGSEECIIENFATLSWGVRIFTSTDDFKFHGFGNSTISSTFRNIKEAPVLIKKFAIIGSNSVVLPGVEIGEGVSVGACSVVTKNLEPWGIYIGNKKIGERDKDGILKNFDNFLKADDTIKNGTLFK